MSPSRTILLSLALLNALVPRPSPAATTISKGPYHGWDEAVTIGNGVVEAIVVPQIGRIMQFRFVGENQGPFWENRALDGKAPNSQSSEWSNFGGDKTWPAPQSEWEKNAGRGWPPPPTFDSVPTTAEIDGESILLRTPIDPKYGIQAERRITLESGAAMRVDTTYLKKSGDPVRVSIWVITQLKDPELMLMPLPEKSLFPAGYNKQSEILPLDLKVEGRFVTCRRSPQNSAKIGSDASRLLWGDKTHIVEVHSAREAGGEFPDQGSSAEIYTNPDPLAYIELELLGPLQTLRVGEKITRSQVYRLYKREPGALAAQMRRISEKYQ